MFGHNQAIFPAGQKQLWGSFTKVFWKPGQGPCIFNLLIYNP